MYAIAGSRMGTTNCSFFGAIFFAIACGLLHSQPAYAQDGKGLIDLFANELQRQIDKQQRKQERRARQQQGVREEFSRSWRECFGNGFLLSCEKALGFSELAPADRERLIAQIERLKAARSPSPAPERDDSAAQQAAARAAAEAEATAGRLRELRIEEARVQAELTKQRQAAQDEIRSNQEEWKKKAEQLRRDFDRAEFELSLRRKLVLNIDECRQFQIGGCKSILNNSAATPADIVLAKSGIGTFERFQSDSANCSKGVLSACDAAIGSQAASDSDKRMLSELRDQATVFGKVKSTLASVYENSLGGVGQSVQSLPASTLWASGLALSLALVLAGVLWTRRAQELSANLVQPKELSLPLSEEAILPPALPTTPKSEIHPNEPPPPAKENNSPRLAEKSAPVNDITCTSVAGTHQFEKVGQLETASITSNSARDEILSNPVSIEQNEREDSAIVAPLRRSDQSQNQSSQNLLTSSAVQQRGVISRAVSHPAGFVLLYVIGMAPTYILPYLGSNSVMLNTAGVATGFGPSPAFWLHVGLILLLCVLAWVAGSSRGKGWIVIFPVLAGAFDLVPGLNFVPFVPTLMHLIAIVLCVASPQLSSQQVSAR